MDFYETHCNPYIFAFDKAFHLYALEPIIYFNNSELIHYIKKGKSQPKINLG